MRGQPFFVCFFIIILPRMGRLSIFVHFGILWHFVLFLFILAFLNRELRGTHLSEIQYLPAYKNLEFKNLLA